MTIYFQWRILMNHGSKVCDSMLRGHIVNMAADEAQCLHIQDGYWICSLGHQTKGCYPNWR